MLVVRRVALAFIPTNTARGQTCFDHGAQHAEISCGLAGRDSGSRRADVGAVETEADAASHVLYVRLSQVRIGAARASLRAVRALGDAANKRRVVKARRLGMSFDDLSDGHVLLLRVKSYPPLIHAEAPRIR
jgi:hypothetical protein